MKYSRNSANLPKHLSLMQNKYFTVSQRGYTVKPVLSSHSKRRPKLGFQDRLSLNAGQKYCRKHSAVLLTFIKPPFVIKTFVLSIFEWLLYTGFTVQLFSCSSIVGIFTFISMINTTYESLKARKVFIFKTFNCYEHLKVYAQSS